MTCGKAVLALVSNSCFITYLIQPTHHNMKKDQTESISSSSSPTYMTCASLIVNNFRIILYNPQLKATTVAVSHTDPMILARIVSWTMMTMPTTWKPIYKIAQSTRKKTSYTYRPSFISSQLAHLLAERISNPLMGCLQIQQERRCFILLRQARLAVLKRCTKYSFKQLRCTYQMEPLQLQGAERLGMSPDQRQMRHCLLAAEPKS